MTALRLVPLDLATFEALARGDVEAAERATGLRMDAWFADRVEIWHYMITLLDGRPDNADWLMQAVVLGERDVIGNAGFKGAPRDGQVELGYSISPDHRRVGHASTVVRLLLDRARADAAIDRVVARIDPGNTASLGVVAKAGFEADGEFMSPRSGLQLQLVRRVGGPPT